MIFSGGFGCPIDRFTCRNGNCVDISRKCDGNDDCGDNSDEDDGCIGMLTRKNNECTEQVN